MQAALLAMAAHSIILSASASPTLFAHLPNPQNPPLHSPFHGVSLKLNRQTHFPTFTATAVPKPLIVVAATKKAVAVLKGNSEVEGVALLTQDVDGTLP